MSDHALLARALQEAEVPTGASLTHGGLCGLLCLAPDDAVGIWLQDTLRDAGTDAAALSRCREVLVELESETDAAFRDPLLGFQPLLPEEEGDIEIRTDALAQWCQGFLYGLGLGGLDSGSLSEECQEALEDLSEIAHAGIDQDEEASDEELERAFTELLEYVRVAAQLLYAELNPRRSDDGEDLRLH